VSVIVVAIMQDIHNSAIPYGDILLRIENATSWHGNILSDTYLDYASVAVAFLAKEGADLKAKESEILNFFRENVWIYSDGLWSDLSFIPLKEVYFHKTNGSNDHLVVQGDKTFVLILLSIGILILVFAVINYVNLTVAQAGFRAKEMSTRRLLGSSREELFSRLMMESTLLCILSFGVGLLLAFAFLPFADNLLEARINLKSVFIPRSFILIIVSLLLIGGLAGFLPAFVISNAKPIEVVKGIFRRDTKMVFSKFFITFQNIITIALATASLVMIFQVDHLIKAPLGYNTVNILDVEVGELNDKELTRTLKGEFERLAAVRRIGFNQGLPFGRGGNYTMKHENKMIQFQSLVGDSTFFNIMGFEILRENHVGTSHAFYLSEQAFRELGIPDDAATFPLTPFWNEPQLIAGKVKDFQLSNIMFEKRPILLRKMRVDDFYPTHLAIEVAGDPFVAYQDIKEIYEQITELEFPGTYVSQQIEESFNQQRKTSRMVIVFTGIAILLSILGLIAMCTYFIQQRSLEVAVRKVFGCSNPEILITLVTTFLSYVVIAFFIVTPFIWYIMGQWLSDYSYRISLSPWIFISSGLFCLITSFITVFWQSYQAANTNPVHMIKTE